MTITPEQDAYLREHRMAVLATGRKDGSPQISTINYHFDGADIVISVTSDRAKWVNTVRQPRVAMLVLDGRKQLILYGTVEGVADDPGRIELTKRLRASMGREPDGDDAALSAQLDEAKRVILRITPDKVLIND
ncbi:MAG: TIGR03618 family F420-dependent PPOX class oxidoreductase [Dehalococcoidia bacterium]